MIDNANDRIQQQMARIAELETAVESHCMCARFEKCSGLYIIAYPEGYARDGLHCPTYRFGKVTTLEKILASMESDWQDSNEWWIDREGKVFHSVVYWQDGRKTRQHFTYNFTDSKALAEKGISKNSKAIARIEVWDADSSLETLYSADWK